MSSDRTEALMRKVRGLLEKAESTPFEEEANTFITKAQELITKYAIDEEELWASDPSRRKQITKLTINIADKSDGAHYRRYILWTIARNNSCRMWYSTGMGESHVAGYPSDLAFVEMLYTSIIVQMNFALAKELAFQSGNTRSFRKAFVAGWSDRIQERLNEAKRAADNTLKEQTGTSTDLVLADRRVKVDEWVNENIGKLRRGRPLNDTIKRIDGLAAGRVAAETADISGGRGGKLSSAKRELPR